MMLKSPLFRFFAPLLAALLLSACAGAPPPVIEENPVEDGGVQLILDPVDLWGGGTATGEQQTRTVGGQTITFRVYEERGFFERAYVRLGLFWDSRRKSRIYMPVVIVGNPSVKVLAAYFKTDGERVQLRPAGEDFQFTAPMRLMDGGSIHSTGAFILPAEVLAKVGDAEKAEVFLRTDQGDLWLDFAVARGIGYRDHVLLASAKYQFAEFYRRVRARL